MISYANTLKKILSRKKKLVYDFLLNIFIASSWIMHNSIMNNYMNIIELKRLVLLIFC